MQRGDKAPPKGHWPAQAGLLDGRPFVFGDERQQCCPQDQAPGITPATYTSIRTGRCVFDECSDDVEDILPRERNSASGLPWGARVQAASEQLQHVFDKLPKSPIR